MSLRRAGLASALTLVAAAAALPAAAEAQGSGDGKKVLIYTGTTGYRHTDGINGGRPVVQSKLEGLGYAVDWEDCSGRGTGANNCNNANKNPRIFTSENLAKYDALVFLNMSWSWNTANPGPLLDLESQKDAIIGFVQNGGGIASIHNATDAGAGRSVWDWWDGSPNSMIGTTMPGHAATNATGNTATVQVADNNHLATRDLPDTWQISDEHYNYLTNVRGGHHVLATFDERTYNPGVNARGQDHPITYCKLYDGESVNDGTATRRAYRDGRTWVTGMGHFGVRYTENGGDNNLVKMIVGGIRWVAGEGRKSDCSGTVWSSFSRQVLVSDALNPIGIDIAKDGKVYWSEIGPSIGFEVNGHIKMHDPKGAPNNKTTVGTIQTRSDHSLSEDGVLGMSLQPGFDLADPSKRNLFVYYSPRNAAWPTTGAAQVVGYNQISRFTLNAEGTSVVDGSERVILRVPKVKIAGAPAGFPGGPTNNGPGHVGGAGLDFDSAGNLYLGVGDDVSPNASGHNGLQPMDYRSAERWDARKTSANTADLRGKVLRITPKQGEIAADAAPGVGTTYDIPEGNLFPVGTTAARPEIYGMGFRQPFTLHTDPANPGLVGVGEYCNDASTDRADRGFAGVCEWNLLNKPGNFGWPFCAGNQSADNTATRWNYATATTTGQKYDCSLDEIPSDINYAPEGQAPNPATFQGRHAIPKPIPATIWKKYATGTGVQRDIDFGDLSKGGMQPVAGPIYRYDASTATAGAFPRYYDGSWLINNRGANDGFWKEVRLRQDNNEMLRVNDWLPYNAAGTEGANLNSLVIGTQFGADGSLYMSRYSVGCCRSNTQTPTQIVKISFNVYDESTAPSAAVELDPAVPGAGRAYPGPVTLKLSGTDAAAASDPNPVSGLDRIEYRDTLQGVPGQWVRLANTAGGNTFNTTATVSEEGNHVIEYRAVDKAGNVGEVKTIAFAIIKPTDVDANFTAMVPTILGLSFTAEPTFGVLMPGTAKDYLAETAAKVTVTTGDAALTVVDRSTTAPGRLVNGSAALPQPVQISAAGGPFNAVSATPLLLKSWATQTTNELVPITAKQPIGVNDALRAGAYGKVLTFSLSTTTP
ncbi:ThuA domain-containing protein [Solirubrobacter phytolaccae]|uniref:ThuA domain-containing protein n=1 Tax=Solirubrobacter phytolaccae TaxID=1404360 RepID=A0A9X3NKQ4_9ACTN|nr:ThuA domain-containing protein [Solirubrobacter phytolaccae]MDA0185381.1 ThuA domain-containing protein [Solirubrobacter phytolaccae]